MSYLEPEDQDVVMVRAEVERGDTAGGLQDQVWVGGVGQGEHAGNPGTLLAGEII